MAQVSLQVGAAGAYSMSLWHKFVTRFSDVANALAASATDDAGAAHQSNYLDEAFLYILSTDATAGQLTIKLEHADTTGGPWTQCNKDALMLLGENTEICEDELVLDMSQAVNQGTLLVTVCAPAREESSGAFVSNLKAAHRLTYTTDGSWNGTEVREIGVGALYHHQGSGSPV